MNFFEHQQQARKQTKKLVAYFFAAIVAIVVLANLALFFATCSLSTACVGIGDYLKMPISWFLSLGILLVIFLTSLVRWSQMKRGGGFKAVAMVDATRIDFSSQDPLERRLINVVEEMSIAAGVPIPSLFVMKNESGINAFVAGTEPQNTCLAVTQGCLETLSRQELQGVVAHEYSHIFNGDMRMNIQLIGLLAGILVIGQLGEFLARMGGHSRGNRKNDGAQIAIVGIALMIVGYVGLFFGRLIKAAISRQREYLADASAVQYTRDNQGIANALFKIQTRYQGSHLSSAKAEEVSHMCFERTGTIKFFSDLLSTHPDVQLRIDRLDANFQPTSTHENIDSTDEGSSPEITHSQPVGKSFSGEISAQSMSEHIGEITESSLTNSHTLLSGFPILLMNFAHGAETKLSGRDLILAILTTVNTMGRADCLKFLEQAIDDDAYSRVIEANQLLKDYDLQQLTTLTELCCPTLTQLEKSQQAETLKIAKQLIQFDREVSLSEYLIFAFVYRACQPNQGFTSRINKYQPVINDIAYLFALIIQQSSHSEHEQQQLLTNTLSTFGKCTPPSISENFNANRFHQSVARLATLSPLLKQPLVESIMNCIVDDGQINANEFALFRSICNLIGVPAPALV